RADDHLDHARLAGVRAGGRRAVDRHGDAVLPVDIAHRRGDAFAFDCKDAAGRTGATAERVRGAYRGLVRRGLNRSLFEIERTGLGVPIAAKPMTTGALNENNTSMFPERSRQK